MVKRDQKTQHSTVPEEQVWAIPKISPEDVKGPFTEESSFATLFPKYREKYIREIFGIVQKSLLQVGIKAELDLFEGSMTVKTTKKTFDPYAIIKARDVIKLLSRSVPYEVCLKLLEDETYCDIIKIKNLVSKKEKFVARRQRLIGPDNQTIKALEILTNCYIMVQGHTVCVIGHFRRVKQVRRIIESCMKNVHPVYFIKQLMVMKELEKNPELKNENWENYLPPIPKGNKSKKLPAKKNKIEKEKKDKSIFPNPVQPRKEDLEMDSGKYFLTKDQRRNVEDQERQQEKEERRK